MMDEVNFMNFVWKNVDEIISLFLNEKASNQNDLISEEIFQALNFLIEGTVDNQQIMPFNMLLKQPLVQSKLNEGKIYVKHLITFLKSYLEINPFGLNNCLRHGKRIAPSYLGGSIDPRKAGKLITNAHTSPANEFLISISQVVKQTLIEVSEVFRNAGLYVDKCLYSFMYILRPLRSCTIKRCRKSLLFIGPTERTLTVDSCAECTIISVCRRIIIKNCSMCTFYLMTPSSPLLLSGCDNIKFAPFNSTYTGIDEDARASGLGGLLNRWDKPVVVTQNQSVINGIHWSLMEPKDFTVFAVPVEASPQNRSNRNNSMLIHQANEKFGTLPHAFEEELNRKLRSVESNIAQIQAAGLNQEQRVMLQRFLENSFRESLQISGEQRQLDHLSLVPSSANGNIGNS